MKPVHLQPAYVLHRRAYRENSFLVDLFTPEFGRLTAVAKGVRKGGAAGLLQPFVPLLVSWGGKGELMTLTHVEAHQPVKSLRHECLFAGFYLNELLTYLLQKWDAQPVLFAIYKQTLAALQTGKLEQQVLRAFEQDLLQVLGYGLLVRQDGVLAQVFLPDNYYRFSLEQGFVLCEHETQEDRNSNIFSGKSLLAIAKKNWQVENSLQDAKRLTRIVLFSLLGTRTLHSRRLFISP